MKKILIIEDDTFLKNLEITKFTQEGFSVSSAVTKAEVDDTLSKELPDIILLDLMLPDLDGFQLLKQFKENESTKSIPIIVFSNLSGESEMKRVLEGGADDYMIKSNFTLSDVIEKINTLISK